MSIESFFCLREQPPRHNPESVADAGQAFRRIKLSSSSTVVVTRDLLEVDDALCNAQGGRELELSWLTPLSVVYVHFIRDPDDDPHASITVSF